jgi:hypothetical protein
MIQAGGGTSFALKSLDAIAIGGQVMPQHLDRHDAPKPPIARAVDLAHPAGAEWLENLIRSEARAGVEGHDSRRKGTRPLEAKSKNPSVSVPQDPSISGSRATPPTDVPEVAEGLTPRSARRPHASPG